MCKCERGSLHKICEYADVAVVFMSKVTQLKYREQKTKTYRCHITREYETSGMAGSRSTNEVARADGA